MPFLAICLFQLPLLIFIASSWYQKGKIALRMSLQSKKAIVILKSFIKQPVIKQSPTFLSFSFLIDCCMSVFFSFLIKAFQNFEKLIRFHRQAFIVHKNGENLKKLLEIFCLKLIVFNVILAFLDHLKPKIFFVDRTWWPSMSAPPFQNLWILPCKNSIEELIKSNRKVE